jgi:hypothetical protein
MGGAAAPLADLMVEIRQVSEPCAMRRPKILHSELAIRLPACSSTPSQRSLPVLLRTGLTKVVFISIVVKACPGSRVECTAATHGGVEEKREPAAMDQPHGIVEAGRGRRLECHAADLD